MQQSTSFYMLCGRHKVEIKAVDRVIVIRLRRCPVCGRLLKKDPITLIPKSDD